MTNSWKRTPREIDVDDAIADLIAANKELMNRMEALEEFCLGLQRMVGGHEDQLEMFRLYQKVEKKRGDDGE